MKRNPIVDEILTELKDEIARKNLYQLMGTTMDEGMSYQQLKTINERYRKLIEELEINGISADSEITGDQMEEFYNKNKGQFGWKDFDFNGIYQSKVFDYLHHTNETSIPAKEFVKECIIIEEKLQMSKASLRNAYDNLKKDSKSFQEQIERHSKNKNEKINLGITLFEANNIPVSESALYIIKSSVGENNETITSEGIAQNSVIFNKNIRFELEERNQVLKLELYKKGILTEKIGQVNIKLEEISPNQQRVEENFNILSDSNKISGSLRVKLHYVYDTLEYFKTLYNDAENKIADLNHDLGMIEQLTKVYNTPFGIVMNGDIDYVNILQKKDPLKTLDDLSGAVRISVFKSARAGNEGRLTVNEMLTSRTESFFNSMTPDKMRIISLIGVIFSIFNNIGRNDYANLIALSSVLFLGDKVQKMLIFVILIFTELADILWIIQTGLSNENWLGYAKVSFFLTAINIILKGVVLYKLKKE